MLTYPWARRENRYNSVVTDAIGGMNDLKLTARSVFNKNGLRSRDQTRYPAFLPMTDIR
jgi:hypothetical protein